ncbi:MAG: hypothetical protein IV100_26500 [Myxococcales bacterium]|nr:hypothetical protein [Myxococcales bacterium]
MRRVARNAPPPFDAAAFIRDAEAALGIGQRSPLERVADLVDGADGLRGAAEAGTRARGQGLGPFDPPAYTEDAVERARMAAAIGRMKAEIGKAEAEADAIRAANERARAEVDGLRAKTEPQGRPAAVEHESLTAAYQQRFEALEAATTLVRRLKDIEVGLTAAYGADAAAEMLAQIQASAGIDRLEVFAGPRPRGPR